MKPAVITPYYKESLETLKRCHRSVACSNKKATHILVADGNGSSHHRPLGLPTSGVATKVTAIAAIRQGRWEH